MHFCIQCGKETSRSQYKYCSNKCQGDYQYYDYILKWQQGLADGGRGINTRNVSHHLRRYLFEKYKSACAICGWNKINTTTGKIPLEIDHVDGNAENNKEENLQLLCPNCHSLTPSYRNLNKGAGRKWRREKYIKSF